MNLVRQVQKRFALMARPTVVSADSIQITVDRFYAHTSTGIWASTRYLRTESMLDSRIDGAQSRLFGHDDSVCAQ